MLYSTQDILKSTNPYELFDNGDALAENRHILDAFSAKEKKTLATKIVSDCPQSQLKALGQAINSLKSFVIKDKETFYSVIYAAHQVRTHIVGLLDPNNMKPHKLFSDESIIDLFNEFDDLTQQTLENHETTIAERIALLTPETHASSVTRTIAIMFERQPLSEAIGSAFTLRRQVKQLLGDNPELFFTSRDFNETDCRKFPSLLEVIKGHEEQIGLKLANVKPFTLRNKIERDLQLLTTDAYDEANPFKLIIDTMQANKPLSPSTSKSSLFTKQPSTAKFSPQISNDVQTPPL